MAKSTSWVNRWEFDMRRLRYLALRVCLAFSLTLSTYAGELLELAEAGEFEKVQATLQGGGDVNAASVDGMTVLLWAAYYDELKVAQSLLKAGAEVKKANRYGVTPLSLACQNGNAKMVKLFLDAGADLKVKLEGGETVLMTAARTGDVDCVKALIKAGAQVEAKESRGQTALMWAAAEGHTAVVDVLIGNQADFKTKLKSGFTPFFFAVRQGHVGVVSSLLKAGVDVNEAAEPSRPGGRNMRAGTSALMLAVENGHFDLAAMLLKLGADPNDERSGVTPLHALSWVRKSVKGDGDDGIPTPKGSGQMSSLKFAEVLVQSGADVNRQLKGGRGGVARVDRKGATPFLLAAQTGDVPFLKTLKALGADATMVNTKGSTPLLAAAGLGVTAPGEEAAQLDSALETVAYLLDLGADINITDKRGETVMHAAAYKSEPKMMRLLDQRGADIKIWNRKNKAGWTPLLITQGYRPGNFRPIATSENALSDIMKKHGVEPTPAPKRKK